MAKTDRVEWHESERIAQKARITIKAEVDIESILDDTATIVEWINSLAGADPATMELTANEKEDTDEHMEGTILEHWPDTGVDST